LIISAIMNVIEEYVGDLDVLLKSTWCALAFEFLLGTLLKPESSL